MRNAFPRPFVDTRRGTSRGDSTRRRKNEIRPADGVLPRQKRRLDLTGDSRIGLASSMAGSLQSCFRRGREGGVNAKKRRLVAAVAAGRRHRRGFHADGRSLLGKKRLTCPA